MLHCQFVKEFVNVSEIELFVIIFNFMLIIVRFSKKKKKMNCHWLYNLNSQTTKKE